MHRERITSRAGSLALALALLAAAPQAFAVMGVGDTTVIVGDTTDTWKWPRELEQWQMLIANTRQQISRTDELIKIAGHPEDVMNTFIQSVPDLLQPIEDAIGLETRQEALRTSREFYSLGSVAVQTYADAKKVGPTYEAFGQTVRRDPSRYTHFIMQEAMNARYKKAVEYAEAVEKKEMKVQSDALEKLKAARTEAEISATNTLVAASKQRLDLAQQKAQQAKGELDAFNGQLVVEDARKAEADREWAQGVVERMRQKALEAYRAQVGGDVAPST